MKVVRAKALFPELVGSKSGLHFGVSQIFPAKHVPRLEREKRLQTITMGPLLERGCLRFAWVKPKEFDELSIESGCFVYDFGDEHYRYYPTMKAPIFEKGIDK